MRSDQILELDTIPRCCYEIQCVPLHAGTIVQRWLWLSKYSPLSSQPCHASLSLFILSLSPLGVFADIPTLSLSFSLSLSVTFLSSLCYTVQPIGRAESNVTLSHSVLGLPVSSFKAQMMLLLESRLHCELCVLKRLLN